jgi:hypothetical protein
LHLGIGEFRAGRGHYLAGGSFHHFDEAALLRVAGGKDAFGGVAIIEPQAGEVLLRAVADDALLLKDRQNFAGEIDARAGRGYDQTEK